MEGYSKPISKTTCYDIELWLPKDSLFQSSQRFCRNGFLVFARGKMKIEINEMGK